MIKKKSATKKVVKPKVKKIPPAELFLQQLADNKLIDLPGYEFLPEHKFHDTRRWRFDFSWLPSMSYMINHGARSIAVEIMGGIWTGGGHVTGMGYENDCEKLNHAVIDGWSVLYITSKMVRDGSGIEYLKQLLVAK